MCEWSGYTDRVVFERLYSQSTVNPSEYNTHIRQISKDYLDKANIEEINLKYNYKSSEFINTIFKWLFYSYLIWIELLIKYNIVL